MNEQYFGPTYFDRIVVCSNTMTWADESTGTLGDGDVSQSDVIGN